MNDVKQMLSTHPIIVLSISKEQFIIEIDASEKQCVICCHENNNFGECLTDWLWSRTLSDAEKTY